MKVTVKATRTGYYDLKRRYTDDVFEMEKSDAENCSWIEADGIKTAVKVPAKAEPFKVPMKKSAKPTGNAEVI